MLKIVEVRNLRVQDGEQILFWEQECILGLGGEKKRLLTNCLKASSVQPAGVLS